MKTIRQHLEELPDPEIRALTLKRMWQDYADEWSESQAKALGRAFLWNRTPEGYHYWHNIHAAMVGNDPLPVPVKKTA